MKNQKCFREFIIRFLPAIFILIFISGYKGISQVSFTRAFSPQEGLVVPIEQPCPLHCLPDTI
jgi:hypothetical protein